MRNEANQSIKESAAQDEKNILDGEVKKKILAPSTNVDLREILKNTTDSLKSFLTTIPSQESIATMGDEARFLKELKGYDQLVKNNQADGTKQTLQGRNHHYDRHLTAALLDLHKTKYDFLTQFSTEAEVNIEIVDQNFIKVVKEFQQEINKISTAIKPKIFADIQKEEGIIKLCLVSYSKFVKDCIKVRKDYIEYLEKLDQYINDIEALFDVKCLKTNIEFKPKITNKLDNQVNNRPKKVIKKQESITKYFDNKAFEDQKVTDIKENKQSEHSISKSPVALNNKNKQKKDNNQQILEENKELLSGIEVLSEEIVLENIQRMFGRKTTSETSLGYFEFHNSKIDVHITPEISKQMIEMHVKCRFECAVLAGVVKKPKSETGIKVLQFQNKKRQHMEDACYKADNGITYKLCEVKVLGESQKNGDWIIGDMRLVCLWDTSTNIIHGFEITDHKGVEKNVKDFQSYTGAFIDRVIPKQENQVAVDKQPINNKVAQQMEYKAQKQEDEKNQHRAAAQNGDIIADDNKPVEHWGQYARNNEESKGKTDPKDAQNMKGIKKHYKQQQRQQNNRGLGM